ncbi:oligopeptide ABC transporter permease [Melissococcus plutonius]|uniref:Oligopeptide transport system permease protein OppC (TC 3.A.1.5.1) n=1 Tax=Melissococcus plutonius (strain ATCC 35311 / DSM 29964 / CIP 104052 / LMG 20360 / NCIMB 702443) TaxID=940190 RepID=F3Y9J4_MELPT|nr:oligopeptide ABC transporter permease [Melissococcus plutonius]AIM24717.1 dipeptide transport system permease protein DppC [Melissococcus plutonius S1]KMT24826.1 dipeptide transport system permease protein DppC [Melissococcus plutonius]KMT26463.1 dipeptide transport system permease protein DppC [Melissococcus plutonius]KMT27713.1 dipeptide transport system permease protein DppC [Melissococcus plutonius]KMT29485.1 dipeptide transport system permease protein DppC [Melissococcus plutonius]
METINIKDVPKDIKSIPADDFQPLDTLQSQEKERIAMPSLSFLQDSWRRLKKNKAAVISMCILSIVLLISIVTIWVTPHNPNQQNVSYINLPPRIPGLEGINGLNGKTVVANKVVDKYANANVPKNVNFYLGTDGLGRDVLSRLFMGTRISLLIALIAALLDITIGVTYGLISGMLGGKVDTVMQRILEIISGIPNLVVMILMLTVLNPGILSIVLAMVITNWVSMARIVRAQALKLKDQEFVLAAQTLGESRIKIAIKHILPNISSVIIVQMMFSIPAAIFFEAFLSFIGLGLRPPTASLGTLLNEGYKTFRFLPYLLWIPAVALSVIMICFNLLADGLRDAFDPKMKE